MGGGWPLSAETVDAQVKKLLCGESLSATIDNNNRDTPSAAAVEVEEDDVTRAQRSQY